MNLQGFLDQYGYLAVLVGTFIEGETLLLLGSYAAHRGYLGLPGVIAAAFVGAVAGDQLYFHVGRRHGAAFLGRHPLLDAKVRRVVRRVERHGMPLVLGMRFMWGMRIAMPIAVGLGGMRAARFVALDLTSAAFWSVGFGLAGFGVSRLLALWIQDLHHHEHVLFAGMALLALAVVTWRWWPRRGSGPVSPS